MRTHAMKCDRSLYDLAFIVHVYEYCCVAYTVYMIFHMLVYMHNHFDCPIFGIAPASPTPPPTTCSCKVTLIFFLTCTRKRKGSSLTVTCKHTPNS